MKKHFLTSLQLLACLLFVLPCYTVYGSQDQPFLAGSQLPRVHPAGAGLATDIELSWPENDGPLHHLPDRCKTCLYRDPDALCPHCHANAPVVNRLYQVIQKDAALARDVKIIGICIGNDKTQIDAFKKSFKVSFPLFPDENLAIAQAVGVKEMPTMVLVTHSGKVL